MKAKLREFLQAEPSETFALIDLEQAVPDIDWQTELKKLGIKPLSPGTYSRMTAMAVLARGGSSAAAAPAKSHAAPEIHLGDFRLKRRTCGSCQLQAWRPADADLKCPRCGTQFQEEKPGPVLTKWAPEQFGFITEEQS